MKSNKYIYIGIGIIALLLYSNKAKAMNINYTFSKFKKAVADRLKFLLPSLINAGFNSDLKLKLAISQLLLETGQFSSKSSVAKLNNNYSGIKYICKDFQKATRGSRTPANEQSGPPDRCGNFYAKFASADDWAVDYMRILNLQRSGNTIGKPIEAIDVVDYNNRLYANGYYQKTPASKASYLKNLQYFFKNID